jgi:hypothetical protein
MGCGILRTKNIGLPGLGSTPDKVIRQAERAEADGFCTLWYATGVSVPTR